MSTDQNYISFRFYGGDDGFDHHVNKPEIVVADFDYGEWGTVTVPGVKNVATGCFHEYGSAGYDSFLGDFSRMSDMQWEGDWICEENDKVVLKFSTENDVLMYEIEGNWNGTFVDHIGNRSNRETPAV